ncbi:hypothetical protein BGAL_0218g00070 [Botrytis galanthina]|uniref:Uncharacterized protein n=1 Tax=Botrytis galanthina TaxID=278940 RepID=A0A4S8R6V4_9HELO|nr:hypothetical protein BGAL_0218g00070 [Botrytis galanthina]
MYVYIITEISLDLKEILSDYRIFESGSNLTLSKLPSLSKSARDLRPSRILILISTSASTHLRAEAMAELVL